MNINGVHKEIIIIIENEKCEIFFLENKKREKGQKDGMRRRHEVLCAKLNCFNV